MATPNIVPRADSEGGLGTSSKYWASAYIDAITTTGDITVGGIVNAVNLNLTDSDGGTMITLDSSSGDGTIRWEDGNTQKWDMGRDNTDNNINHDISYIYIAFAEMPFKYSNAV